MDGLTNVSNKVNEEIRNDCKVAFKNSLYRFFEVLASILEPILRWKRQVYSEYVYSILFFPKCLVCEIEKS